MGLRLLSPDTTKLIGANLTVKPSQAGSGLGWLHFFNEWDWTGWIKPQIDHAVNDIGVNCIRIVGAVCGIYNGTYTQVDYNNKWIQLATYLDSLGIYLIASGGNFVDFNSGHPLNGATNQQAADYVVSSLKAIATYNCLIGCDVFQEGDNNSTNAAQINDILAKVRAGINTIPLTASYANTPLQGQVARDWIASITELDYIDFHIYEGKGYDATNPLTLANINYWRSTYPTTDLIFGEYGKHVDKPIAEIVSYYNSVLSVATTADSYMRGALVWAVQDQSYTASFNLGLYDNNWNPRTAQINVLRSYTGVNAGITAPMYVHIKEVSKEVTGLFYFDVDFWQNSSDYLAGNTPIMSNDFRMQLNAGLTSAQLQAAVKKNIADFVNRAVSNSQLRGDLRDSSIQRSQTDGTGTLTKVSTLSGFLGQP